MTVEAATTIAQLNTLWPLFDDQIVEGDDHIRLLKQVMKNDALSRSLGTSQTVVGPVTFNGLVTGKGNFRVENTTPIMEYRETDQALPIGLYRFSLSSDIFRFQKNTAAAGDFATATTIWSFTPADGYINWGTSRFTGVPRLESTQPAIVWRETDQVLPVGLYRAVASSGNYHIQVNTALAGDFATAVDILKFTASTGRINFGYPVDFTGGFSPGQSLEISGAAPALLLTETDQTDPAGRYRWQGVGGNLQLQKALTVGWGTSEVLSEYDTALSSFRFNKLIRIDSTPAPSITFRQSDAAFPGGLFRIRVTSNGLRALCNTALAGDFSTEQSIWRYTGDGGVGVPGVFSFDVPVASFKVRAVTPIITWEASGATPPAGQYRQYISGGDTFNFQRALTADFATNVTIWSSAAGNDFTVPPVCKLATTGGTVEIGSTAVSEVVFKRTGVSVLRVPDAGSLRVMNVAGTSWAAVSSATGWAAGASDVRLKENIGDISYGLDAVLALRPVQFDWIEGGKHDIGFIAQEVEDVVPEIVEVWGADPDIEGQIDTYAMRKDALTVVLVKAMQEQQGLIGSLVRRVTQLEARL